MSGADRWFSAPNPSAGVHGYTIGQCVLPASVRAGREDWVVTHGEPKTDPLLVTGNGLRLTDRDTAANSTLVEPENTRPGQQLYDLPTGRRSACRTAPMNRAGIQCSLKSSCERSL